MVGRLPSLSRRQCICRAVGLAVFACAPFVARAQTSQPVARMYRIGYIQTATVEEQAHLTRAFEDGMRELGYVEGRNTVYERRFAAGKQERLPELAADLVRLKVDVIVTGANPVIAAVRQATTSIPIVMAGGRDPVGSGFIASLARPGGNITGLTNDPSPEVHGKRLQLLLAALPHAKRVGFLWNPLPPGAQIYRRALEQAAGQAGVALQVIEARGRGELEGAFATAASGRVDAIVVDSDPVFFTARSQIVELAARHRMPAMYQAREMVDIGGLMSYGDNVSLRFQRAATYVDRILKGSRPGDLPVEQASSLELVLNLRTARELSLELPASLLQSAHAVVR